MEPFRCRFILSFQYLIIVMMKIRKSSEKCNTKHFASHDAYFPFQQEIPDKNVLCLFERAVFLCKSPKLSPVSRDICLYLSQYKF